jgi:hypothetical protein
MSQGIFKVEIDVSGYALCQNWRLRVFSGSQLMSQGMFCVKFDVPGFSLSKWMSQGAFSVTIEASGCFPAHTWCVMLFFGSKWMSQAALHVKMDVSGCFLGHDWCLTVCSASKLMCQYVFRLTIDVSRYILCRNWCPRVFPFKMDVSGCFQGHELSRRVFSCFSRLVYLGVFHVTVDVPQCFLGQNWCLRLLSGPILMSQRAFWVKIDRSGCRTSQNECCASQCVFRVRFHSQSVLWVTIDVSWSFPY